MGYLLDGSQSRSFWCEFQQTQTDPLFTWMNNGFLMESLTPLPVPLQTGAIAFTIASQLLEATVFFSGRNEIQVTPEEGWTVEWIMEIRNWEVFPDLLFGGVIGTQLGNAPRNNDEIIIPGFQNIPPFQSDPPFVIGGCVITPLKACHNCVTELPTT
ncbi:unnamed protein product [marine sediment metagenome]|uniref:Uncharacterized protein n=1 Tax=marine sediment metagenome TaxID=412755 RepID=X0Z3A7_9ZZZZ